MAHSLDELVDAVLAGDAAAWCELTERLLPQIDSIARSHPAMRKRGLAQLSDDVAEVTTATLERLARDDYRNLTRYLEQRDQPELKRVQSFESWLYGAADFVIREHMRKRYGRAPKPPIGGPSEARPSRRDLGTNASRLDEESFDRSYVRALGVTTRLSLAEIFAFVDAEFDTQGARAMQMYYRDDCSFDQIAAALELSEPGEAERLIRRLNARLRHRFASSEG